MTATRIVVADPCPNNRESLAELLRHSGFAADPVADLDALTARLRAGHADLVITELFGSPEATCQAIRGAEPGVGICIYTAWTRPGDACCPPALDCQHFVKPEGLDRLLERLGRRPDPGPHPQPATGSLSPVGPGNLGCCAN